MAAPPVRSGSAAAAMRYALTPTAAAATASHPRPCVLLRRGGRRSADLRCRRRLLTARGERPADPEPDGDEDEEDPAGFDAAVALFNSGEYHACHDVVEELWYGAEEPVRTLLHGLLQCAVGFHHLFHQNHRGAMMELGEGLCKLRKLSLPDEDDGGGGGGGNPFARFREEVAAVLSFLYRTQKELAACTDELCLTMDGSASSYQLLGNFAAGQRLYRLQADVDGVASIAFSAAENEEDAGAAPVIRPRVKLPRLHATEQHLTALQCAYEYTAT